MSLGYNLVAGPFGSTLVDEWFSNRDEAVDRGLTLDPEQFQWWGVLLKEENVEPEVIAHGERDGEGCWKACRWR